MEDRKKAQYTLEQAMQVVMNERGSTHGEAENSFAMIGELWRDYILHANSVRMKKGMKENLTGEWTITAFDVAQMMVLLKVARSVYGNSGNPDNYVDAAGYSSLAAMLARVVADSFASATQSKLSESKHTFAGETGSGISGMTALKEDQLRKAQEEKRKAREEERNLHQHLGNSLNENLNKK